MCLFCGPIWSSTHSADYCGVDMRASFFALPFLVIVLVVFRLVYVGWLQVPDVGPGRRVVLTSRDPQDVAQALREAGIIPGALSFRGYLAFFDRREGRIKAGEYELRAGTPYRDLVAELIVGVPKTEVAVRVIEGWTVSDIEAELVQEFQVSSTSVRAAIGERANGASFDPLWREEFSFLKPLPKDRSLEGYLFPDTYRVWKEQLPESLVRKQLQAFEARVAGLSVTEKSLPLKSLDEVLRLASIVEKEVPNHADRRLVAGVFLTRLRERMPLQSDATVQYVTQSGRARSTSADLETASAFNTYKQAGLPPAPIANPSLSSIQAVLDPDIRGYRYFLTDEQGKVYYATTFEGHIANRRKAGY